MIVKPARLHTKAPFSSIGSSLTQNMLRIKARIVQPTYMRNVCHLSTAKFGCESETILLSVKDCRAIAHPVRKLAHTDELQAISWCQNGHVWHLR